MMVTLKLETLVKMKELKPIINEKKKKKKKKKKEGGE